jgi:hypothetical protein
MGKRKSLMTNFKPGMHQMVEEKGIDFEAIIVKMARAKPRAAFPMMGWGKKCFIEATLKKKGNRVVVEIFSEVTFNAEPNNPEIGYTRDEANIFQGVCVTDYANNLQPKAGEISLSQGEVMKYSDFADQYIINSSIRVTLDRVMENMTDLLAVSDQMLDRLNSAWENRDPGEKKLFTVQYM